MPFETFDRPTRHKKTKTVQTLSSSSARSARKTSHSKREQKERLNPRGSLDASRQNKVEVLNNSKQLQHQTQNIVDMRVEPVLHLHKSSSRTSSSSNKENEHVSLLAKSSSASSGHKNARKRQHGEKADLKTTSEVSPCRIFDGSSRMLTTPMMPRRSAGPAAGRSINSRQPYPFPTPTIPPVPFLRQTSSTNSVYRHQDLMPPQLSHTSSMGRDLMTAPMLETPQQHVSPLLRWLTPGVVNVSTNSNLLRAATLGQRLPSISGQVNSDTSKIPDAIAGLLSMEKGCPSQLNSLAAAEENLLEDASSPQTSAVEDTRHPAQQPATTAMMSANRANLSHPFQNRVVSMHQAVSATPQLGTSVPMTVRSLSQGGSPLLSAVASASSMIDYSEQIDNLSVTREGRTGLRDLFKDVPLTNRPCKCANTRCLKLYCECFHYGFLCDARLCNCKNCCNNEENNETRGPREIAIRRILARRPDAFDVKVPKKKGKGCGCKTCGCLKKYCECLALGKFCTQECTCTKCENRK